MSAAQQRQSKTLVPQDVAAEWVAVDELVEWDDNPKPHEDVSDIVDSVERFGFGDPLVARRANKMVLAGHGRLKAARMLGMQHVPVRFLDLAEREAHLYALTVNRLNEKSIYDPSKLLNVLGRYEPVEQEMAGWTGIDIAQLAKDALGGSSKDVGEGAAELDPDGYELAHRCPKCGFEFNDK